MRSKATIATQLRFLFTFVVYIVPHGAFRALGAIVRAWKKNLPLGPSIWNGFAGALMTNTPPRQLQAILPSTFDTYNAWILSRNATCVVDVLDSDESTRLLWIGPRTAKRVVLFFHGGGYVMPLLKGHLDWMKHLREEALGAKVDLSVCILEYDLIPTNPYPRQMLQSILAFEHLLRSGYSPADIVFGGDSAGGHLSLSLMAYLHRHRPNDLTTKDLINLHGPVKGCFLVSPLASLNLRTPSYERWLSADILTRKNVAEWGKFLVDNSPWSEEISAGNGWGMALDVPESWWENLTAVDRIIVTGGYEEVFCDHIQQLHKMLQRESRGDVTLCMANEAHDGPLMDFEAGRLPSETTKAIVNFVISCFK